jgi:DNA processing protein
VGSRKASPYGRQVTEKLSRELAEQGIVIVSGLALGTDSIAHQAALDAGGATIAVLPSSLDEIYPATHRQLAEEIVRRGGALVSEYAPGAIVTRGNFIARNRLIAALADVTLVPEAALKSGSLHTARFALEQGNEVLAVPGNITSPTSEGTNNLIKAGATPVTDVDDILHILNLPRRIVAPATGDTPAEQRILDLLGSGLSDGYELQLQSKLPTEAFNQSLTMLEISGKVRSLGANRWSL